MVGGSSRAANSYVVEDFGIHPWLCRFQCRSGKPSWPSPKPEDTVAIPLAQLALTFFAREYDKLQTLCLSRVVQPGTVLMGHDWPPGEPGGSSRWRCASAARADGNRGTLETSTGDNCFKQRYVHDLDKWQTMPTEYSFKRVHGAGDLIPRRFVIKVGITAATSLLKLASNISSRVRSSTF